jgi:hypothetical protein
MRKLAAVASGAAMIGLSLLMGAPPSSASSSSPLPPGFQAQAVCDAGGGQYCLNDNDAASAGGTPILMENERNNVPAQAIQINQATGYCNDGKVDSGCPFGPGAWDPAGNPSWNNTYANDPIVQLNFFGIGTNSCLGINGNDEAVLESCALGNEDNTLWIDSTDKSGCANFISATLSYGSNEPAALTGSSILDAQANITPWVDGYLQEWNCS